MSNLLKRWSRLAAAALFFCAGALQAQSDARAAYLGLLHTPAGGLAPLLPDGGFSIRYGHFGEGRVNNEMNTLAGTVAFVLPDDATNIAVTLGGYHESCPDPECQWKLMGGLGAAHGLYSTYFGATTSGALLGIAVDGEFGWGAETFDTSWWGARFGLPTALYFSTGMTGARITPFVVPSIAYGHAHVDTRNFEQGFGAFRAMLGGGLEIATSGGSLRARVGFTRVALDDGKTGFGASLSVRP